MENVKGFQDFSGEEALKREKVREIIIKDFKLYGFEPAETPVIEQEEFVKSGNANDEAISDIFKLKDKGERNLALRYEFTFQLSRLAKNKKLPYKRYQIGEVFRDEPVSSNRFRQFTQADADIVGISVKDEAELLTMASRILKELGIDAEIKINNRKLVNEILDSEKIKDKDNVIKEIDKLDKLTEEEVKKNLKKYKAEKILAIFKKPEKYFERFESFKEIKELEKYCNFYNIKVSFQPSLARGLSYYNSSIFEIKSSDMKETIAAGGSYMIKEFQSSGISFGIERMSQLAKIKIDEKRILIIAIGSDKEDKEAMKISEKLRNAGIPCMIIYGRPSKALEYANTLGIPKALFIGSEELKKKKIKIKDMKTGKEELVSEGEIEKKLKD